MASRVQEPPLGHVVDQELLMTPSTAAVQKLQDRLLLLEDLPVRSAETLVPLPGW